MHYYEVAPNQIVRASSNSFTYSSTHALSVGQLVRIEVGKKSLVGLVIKKVAKPSYDTKTIAEVLDARPLPVQLINAAVWMSSYYNTHLATVLQTILPRGLTKNRRTTPKKGRETVRERTNFVLNNEQQEAVDTIESSTPGTSLLHGITGSGKTHVYIELAKRALGRGESVIMLVPEISLTSQLVDEFSHHFDNILLSHSKQTESFRHQTWTEVLMSDQPRIAIGPRSALFLPLKKIGVILIDEAHEPSFKQEQSPRYSALRTASVLASQHRAKLVLGSATPSVADYYLAEQAKRPIVSMNHKARQDAQPPSVHVVDMTKREGFKRHRFLSNTFLDQAEEVLASGNQVLVFHNRRGTTTTTLCENCAWSATCPRCFTPMTLHGDKHHLRCHICGHTENIPTSCPVCRAVDIVHKGIGTKLIESEIQRLFPNKVVARFDGDTSDSETVEQRYNELYNGSIDIIVGTQVIAKGLDLPKLRVVGVLQADAGLSLPDYGASERTFQLLAQVIGRVGRSNHQTSVIVQTYQPTHPAIEDGVKQDYESFLEATLNERKRENFPPFTHLLKLTTTYKTEAAAVKNAQKLVSVLRKECPETVELLGPAPAFYERQHGSYRWQIILKSPIRADLINALSHLPPTNWQYELDPISLL
ncbi:MAG TPA: primosomal protein N' [Candidatus Saccharimonadales bacterium]|nr:primosomal protein N' [Candidatus Saccharimonadales bacterium]